MSKNCPLSALQLRLDLASVTMSLRNISWPRRRSCILKIMGWWSVFQSIVPAEVSAVNKFDRSGAIRLDIPENALCGLTRLKGWEGSGSLCRSQPASSPPLVTQPFGRTLFVFSREEQCSRIIVRVEKKRAKWNGRSCALSRS
jgi:hypothetical protein